MYKALDPVLVNITVIQIYFVFLPLESLVLCPSLHTPVPMLRVLDSALTTW